MEVLFYFTLAIEIALILLSDAKSGIPKFRDDYKYEKAFQSFYKLHKRALTWSEGYMRCEEEGGALFVPEGLDEATAVAVLLGVLPLKYPGAFIGAHGLYSEMTFVTLWGEEMLGSVLALLWDRGEPHAGADRCVGLRRSGRLFAHPCDRALPFICKVNASDINYHGDCDTFDTRWVLKINNWYEDQSCYFISHEALSWRAAYTSCVAAGGHLTVINSKNEAKIIQRMIVELGTNFTGDSAFIGFSDHFQKYHYRTVHGDRLESTGYDNWALSSTCDKDKYSPVDLTAHCGAITRSGLLTTVDCDIPRLYVCEKPGRTPRKRDGGIDPWRR